MFVSLQMLCFVLCRSDIIFIKQIPYVFIIIIFIDYYHIFQSTRLVSLNV